MLRALQKAGFVAIEQGADGVIYARVAADLPEFTATPTGGQWRLSVQWPLRATGAQRADWQSRHPDAPLDVDLGETRMQLLVDAGKSDESALHWANLTHEMLATCMAWRRVTRQMDEGM